MTKCDNKKYKFKIYDTTNNYSTAFAEYFGDGETSFIKANEVVRHECGSLAIAYIDNGVFKIRVYEDFNKTERTQEEIDSTEINVNDLLKIDNSTQPNQEYSYPFISIVFIEESTIFVNLFHNQTKTHYHFIYDLKSK
jgi:hypothetical protein